jgi:hypothetical protein
MVGLKTSVSDRFVCGYSQDFIEMHMGEFHNTKGRLAVLTARGKSEAVLLELSLHGDKLWNNKTSHHEKTVVANRIKGEKKIPVFFSLTRPAAAAGADLKQIKCDFLECAETNLLLLLLLLLLESLESILSSSPE